MVLVPTLLLTSPVGQMILRQPPPSHPSKWESVQEHLCAPPDYPGSRDTLLNTQVTQEGCSAPPNIQKQSQADVTFVSLCQEASAGGVCVAAKSSCVGEGTRLKSQPGDSRWAAGIGVVTLAA